MSFVDKSHQFQLYGLHKLFRHSKSMSDDFEDYDDDFESDEEVRAMGNTMHGSPLC